MLDRPLYDEWIKRLRSGEWQQGKNILCRVRPDGSRRYCCLGVLAEIMVQADLMTASVKDGEVDYESEDERNDDPFVYLPQGTIHIEVQRKLSVANDITNLSFVAIADLIERELELAITDPPVDYEDTDQRLGGNDA